MKKFMLEFIRRGFIPCGFGPLVLAVVYLILQKESNLQMLPVTDVCLVVFTVIFVLGYLLIWAIIYAITKRNTTKLNQMLKER